MSDDALVTAADVARLAGVGRAAVSNWRRRHADFPEPVLGSGATPSFRLTEVERWLRRQGKVSGDRPAEALWRALDATRGDGGVPEGVADVATYLRNPESAAVLEPRVQAVLDDLGDESPDELIELLCTRLFERQQRQHLATPAELARIMVELAAPIEGTVFDPACGPGNVLHAAAERGADRLVGQEINPGLARLAQARLNSRDIAEGDALRADAFPELRADAVLCDPPFGYRDWGHEDLGIDPRWEYGYPVKSDPELAWVQHCLAHAKPGGSVVLALPAGVASRRSGRMIRQALLRRGAVRAIIALPAGVLMSTGIAIHLWVLRNPDQGAVDPIMLVDASRHQPERRGRADWSALREEVLGAWRQYVDSGSVEEIAGVRRVVQAIDLLDEDVDLTPSRHLPPPAMELDVPGLERTRTELIRTLGELRELLPEMRAESRTPRAYTTINDLARAGALVLRQQVKQLDLNESEDADGPLVLTGRDVATGSEPTARLNDNQMDQIALEHLRPGDLVVPLLVAGDGRPKPRVITTEGLVLGPNLQLIRVDDERLDADFLAGHIRACTSLRASSSTLSGVHRLDVRRIEIPVLDIGLQERLGATFYELAMFADGIRQAANLGTGLTRSMTDGLAAGTLAPLE
ncbi:N-6 DNA methylase [Amycolatopsis palatopharyngis]|uniref:N-6 DNA methylase n=1 Tax=Amycolatopsis palatopharyngis TaxID=187982 RepID=UPI000E236308|nr:N-6 DNA methylase [Amycolatopsis palatopharyngis]